MPPVRAYGPPPQRLARSGSPPCVEVVTRPSFWAVSAFLLGSTHPANLARSQTSSGSSDRTSSGESFHRVVNRTMTRNGTGWRPKNQRRTVMSDAPYPQAFNSRLTDVMVRPPRYWLSNSYCSNFSSVVKTLSLAVIFDNPLTQKTPRGTTIGTRRNNEQLRSTRCFAGLFHVYTRFVSGHGAVNDETPRCEQQRKR